MRIRFFGMAPSALPFALSLVGAMLFALCDSVWAQQPTKVSRIGYLAAGDGRGAGIEALRQRLGELGYTEGKNIVIESRWAEGKYDRLPDLAGDLVRLKVDVVVAGQGGVQVARAAKNATTTIPIVALHLGGDPVALGLVASFSRPGGNLTGFSNLAPELAWRRLELVKETIPNLTRVAFFWSSLVADPSNPGASRLEETQVAARGVGA